MAENSNQNLVELICVKEGSKLRVKIISPGYLHSANCQFPRNLRIEGRKFHVPAENIKLIKTNNKWFYSVKKGIVPIDPQDSIPKIQIFEDENVTECNICMASDKNTIFHPCGHYYTCAECSNMVDDCPICRTPITMRILRHNMG